MCFSMKQTTHEYVGVLLYRLSNSLVALEREAAIMCHKPAGSNHCSGRWVDAR